MTGIRPSCSPARRARRPLGRLAVTLAIGASLALPTLAATSLGAAPAVAASSGDSTNVRIAMTENNGLDVIVAGYQGAMVSAPGVASSPAVRFQQTGTGSWNIETSTGCDGGTAGWSAPVAVNQSTPTASPVGTGLLTLCVASGSVTVHGTLTGLYTTGNSARTVNTLPLEQYVADTAPGESPSSWGSLGGAGPQGQDWGFQELEAQAVAVRSYVMANLGGYGGYADTCDLTCQTYRGIAYENPLSTAAANDTVGQVMEMPGGAVATTEYSASSGGETAGSPFTIVPDDGDAVCVPGACNPNHNWSGQPVSVSAAAIQAQWPAIGTFVSATVTARNNQPNSTDSRVTQVSIAGSASTVTTTGAQFADDLGLKSSWFTITAFSPAGVTLTGHGWGHGIGMGQWGALGYAIGQDNGDGNYTWQQIVSHFYAPATIASLGSLADGGTGGYWLDAADGGVFSFGNATYLGSMGGRPLNRPIVGMAATPDHNGYWQVASDGGIFSFGDAAFYGSTGSLHLNQPVVGMAATPDGQGYWLVASDGGIFAYGDAAFYGSTGSMHLNQPVVGMAPTADGKGYWLVAADGGIFAYGDAAFHGSTGSLHLVRPVVGMAAAPDGGGYWLVAADGGVFTFGDAAFYGSAAGTTAGSGAVALLATKDGGGYYVVNGAGRVSAFGDALQRGDLSTVLSSYGGHVVGGATTPD